MSDTLTDNPDARILTVEVVLRGEVKCYPREGLAAELINQILSEDRLGKSVSMTSCGKNGSYSFEEFVVVSSRVVEQKPMQEKKNDKTTVRRSKKQSVKNR